MRIRKLFDLPSHKVLRIFSFKESEYVFLENSFCPLDHLSPHPCRNGVVASLKTHSPGVSRTFLVLAPKVPHPGKPTNFRQTGTVARPIVLCCLQVHVHPLASDGGGGGRGGGLLWLVS